MYTLERQFVTTAHREIRVLEDIWGGDIAENYARDTKKALQTIKRSALSVQARAVFRSAALCEDICVRLGEGGGRRLARNLSSLKALIGQYSNGLFEIDPDFESMLNLAETNRVMPTLNDIPQQQISEHAKAVETLSPLLKLVKQSGCQTALHSLINAPNTLHAQSIDTARPKQSLDAIMRPITNLVLSEARQNGKTVSVSYGADFHELSEVEAKKIERFLQLVCLNIVTDSIEYAPTQISITGKKQDKMTGFTISWVGKALNTETQANSQPNSHFSKAMTGLRAQGGDIKFKQGALQQDVDQGISLQNMVINFPKTHTKRHSPVSNILDRAVGDDYG